MAKDGPVSVVSLHLYPVKSCHRIDVDAAQSGERGLQGDREWMITDVRGRFLTQRTHPQLALIRPEFEGAELVLRHPRLAPLRLPRDADPAWEQRQVQIFDDTVDAAVACAEACAWISDAAGAESLLVRAGAFTQRQPSGPWRGDRSAPVNFPDAYPLLVCNLASLEDLNRRLPEPLPMTRFRPNLVIDGLPAYGEDEIAELRFGTVRLRLVKACTRCSTTTIDQERGVAAGNPLDVLKSYRFDRSLRGVTFGQNALLSVMTGEGLEGGESEADATLSIGDRGVAEYRRAG